MALYRPKGSKVWWYDFEFNGQRIRESTKSKSKTVAADAQRARRRELEENFNGIKKRDPPKTFSAAAAETLLAVRSKLSRNSLNIHTRNIGTLNPLVGKKLLSNISMQDIETITSDCLAHGDSNRYINMKIGTLRYILRRYKQWEHLGKDYKKLKERTDCGKELSLDEEKRLLEACRASASRGLYTAVTLGLYAGMRRDEVRLLRWSQIDLEIEYLTIGDSKTTNREGRIVPLIGPALEAMKAWASLFPGRLPTHYVFPKERYAVKSRCKRSKNL